jgi:hypothetical protein
MIFTMDRQDGQFDKNYQSDTYLNTVLIYFPKLKAYMDLENIGNRCPVYEESAHGQDGLFIKFVELGGNLSPVSSIKRIEAFPSEKNIIEEKYQLHFNDGLATTVTKYSKSFAGNTDQNMRIYAFMVDEDERKELFEKMIKNGQPQCELTDLELLNYNYDVPKELSQPFMMKATLTGSDLLEFAGDKTLFKVGKLIGIQAELYNEKPRQNPINLNHKHAYKRTLEIQIPEGKRIGGLDQLNRKIICQEGSQVHAQFISSYTLEGQLLTIVIDESYFTMDLGVQWYEDFRNVINAAADFNKIDLLLE